MKLKVLPKYGDKVHYTTEEEQYSITEYSDHDRIIKDVWKSLRLGTRKYRGVDSLIITGEDEVLDECFCSRKPLVEQLREIAEKSKKNMTFACEQAQEYHQKFPEVEARLASYSLEFGDIYKKLLVLVAKIEGNGEHEKTG
jgi:hypothetical protein